MPLFRKRPVEVMAVQWTGKNSVEILNYCSACDITQARCIDAKPELYINTLEGKMRAKINDWVIRGVEGEFYAVDNAIFSKTYEPYDWSPSE